MPITRYDFSQAVNAFFEMPTEAARAILPPHLEPLELHHGSGIFAVTAFHFTGSMVGEYHEIVLAVIVPPRVEPGGDFPNSAFYPFIVGTSTPESREHAIQRWHLPHHMADVQLDMIETDGQMDVKVVEDGKPILDFSIRDRQWTEVTQLYQCFMKDNSGRYKVDMHLKGQYTDHEEETGTLTLHEHPMTSPLPLDEVQTFPFREMWMKDGCQLFQELQTI